MTMHALRRPTVVLGLLGLTIAIIFFVVGLRDQASGDVSNRGNQSAIIMGFTALWITTVLTSLSQQFETSSDFAAHSKHVSTTVADLSSNMKSFRDDAVHHRDINQALMEYLQIDKICQEDPWLLIAVRRIVKIRGDSLHQRAIVQQTVRQTIDEFMAMSAVSIGVDTLSRIYQKSDELERMRLLKSMLANVEDYAWAVTNDIGSYVLDIWSGLFSEGYVAVNNDVVLRGSATVTRIFILDREEVNNSESPKRKLIENIIAKHPISSKMIVRVVYRDRLPDCWKEVNTSMLVCDDCLASESYDQSVAGGAPGYIVVNNREKVKLLKDRFEHLLLAPDENWVKR